MRSNLNRDEELALKSQTETSEIVIFESEDGSSQLEVHLKEETLWLRQDEIASLFDKDRTVITKHIKSVFDTKELDEKSNVQKMHIPNSDKPVKFYNLDVILSVGYRVNSKRGTQFRIWANRILKDHLLKGYSLNEKRLTEQARNLEKDQSLSQFRTAGKI